MSMMLNATAVALATLMMIASASASARDRSDRRQENQGERVCRGYASGELTGREARRLAGEQRRVARFEGHLKADGAYSRRDKVKMEIVQDAASADIDRLRHNDRVRN